jgi:hypothetical protein
MREYITRLADLLNPAVTHDCQPMPNCESVFEIVSHVDDNQFRFGL